MPIPQGPELLIILVLALVLFGAGKLGDVGGALGRSIREFRRASSDEDPSREQKRAEEHPAEPPRTP
jgi:sec-independent protein translocase protein TatA